MPSKKMKFIFLIIISFVFILLSWYLRLPQNIYKSAFIERTRPSSSVSDSMRGEDECANSSSLGPARIINNYNEKTKKPEPLNKVGTGDKDQMPLKRHSRLEELSSTEHQSVYRGLAIENERLALQLEQAAYEYGFRVPIYPYREYVEEVYALLESRGYNRDEFYFYYEDYLENFNSDWLSRSSKIQQIIALAEKTGPSQFIQEVEMLFEDKTNIGLMILRHEAYHAQAMVENLFEVTKDIIIALDNYDLKYVDKRALLYPIMQSASFFGFMQSEIGADDTALQRPQKVSIAHPEFLVGLELDGQL